MSQEIIIRTDNLTYAGLIIDLAKKLGLNLTINPKNEQKQTAQNSNLQKIIEEGGDMSYVNDPADWQRKIRKDRNIL